MKSHALRARLLAGAVSAGLASAGAALADPADQTPSQAPPKASSSAPQPGEATSEPSGDANVVHPVIIVANRYQATRAQLKAENTVSVLSAADLERTAVHNVAEALGLLPGVNVMNTGSGFLGGVDSASRAEGQYVSLRGLNSEYNINQINGVDVAQGSPYTRGVQLSLLPPSGLQTIVLNLSSTPDMDGDAIGGTVDFHTPSAFDFGGERSGSLTIGGRYESRAEDYGRSGLGYNVAADTAWKFGPGDQFGVYASGFYDVRNFDNSFVGGIEEAGCCDFGWDYAVQGPGPQKNNAPGLNPAQNLLLTGANFSVSSGYTERWGGNTSFDWRPDTTTRAYVKLTYAYALTRQDSHNTQIVAEDKLDGGDGAPIGSTGLYQPILGAVSTRFWYQTNPEEATLATAQVGGQKTFGGWTVAPNIFMSWGRDDRPDHIEVASRILDPGSPFGGTTLFTYQNGFPIPLLTPAAKASLYDIAGQPAVGGPPELTKQFSGQLKDGAKLDVKYDFGAGWLKDIKFGVKYQTSWRAQTNRDYTDPNYGAATTFGQLGIIDGYFKNVYPGLYNWASPDLNQAALFNLFYKLGGSNLASLIDSCGSPYLANMENCNTQKATETVTSGYAMAHLQFGDVEIIPGVRFEHTDIRNTYWVTVNGGASLGNFASNEASFDEPLPSLFINYRPNPNAVYRFAVWKSYTRPPFLDLGGGAQTSISGGVTTITEGNPHLKAIDATNVDLGGEWDSGAGGHLSISGYYKRLEHYIYDNSASFSNAQATIAGSGTVINTPVNGGAGTVGGVQIAARQKFQGLQGPFDGLGVSGNVTRQWTSVDLGIPGFHHELIQNAPGLMANAQIFWEKNGMDVELLVNYTGPYISFYDQLNQGADWDNEWLRPVTRLDMHAGLSLPHHLKLDLSISNLTGAYTYWAHIGKNNLAISDIVNSGTTGLLNLTYKF